MACSADAGTLRSELQPVGELVHRQALGAIHGRERKLPRPGARHEGFQLLAQLVLQPSEQVRLKFGLVLARLRADRAPRLAALDQRRGTRKLRPPLVCLCQRACNILVGLDGILQQQSGCRRLE
eukprot:7164888-Prymnesium_polylepis.1